MAASAPPEETASENAVFSSTDSAGVVARVGSCWDSAELEATSGRNSVDKRVSNPETAAVAASPVACAGGATARPTVEITANAVVDARTDLRSDATWLPRSSRLRTSDFRE